MRKSRGSGIMRADSPWPSTIGLRQSRSCRIGYIPVRTVQLSPNKPGLQPRPSKYRAQCHDVVPRNRAPYYVSCYTRNRFTFAGPVTERIRPNGQWIARGRNPNPYPFIDFSIKP